MVTPEVDPPDEIAQAAADDVRNMFQRSGLREIVQLANDVAAQESVSPEHSPLPERPPVDERRYSA